MSENVAHPVKRVPLTAQPREAAVAFGVGTAASLTFGVKFVAVMGIATGIATGVGSANTAHANSAVKNTMVELFTSHGCSSCPPADRLLAKLIAADPDLVALEYHVDYWDSLVHGSAGSFADPFADSEYTLRQQAYNNRRMTGRAGVYTPQMIINGNYAAVGSQHRYVEHAITTSKAMELSLELVPSAAGEVLDIDIKQSKGQPTSARAEVWLALFDVEQTTEITGGENKNLTLVNHHVVRDLRPVGQLNGQGFQGRIEPGLAEGQGCALFVQGLVPGTVLGAANCPREVWR